MITDAEIQELRKRNPYRNPYNYGNNAESEWDIWKGYIRACDELEKMQNEN